MVVLGPSMSFLIGSKEGASFHLLVTPQGVVLTNTPPFLNARCSLDRLV
jgi:hypothetical protein